MKKSILSIVLMCMVFGVYAQDRVNLERPKWIDYTPNIATTSGWCLNETTGQWVENINVINRVSLGDKITPYTLSKNEDNAFLKNLHFRKFIYKGVPYYVLSYTYYHGYYKYEYIQEDWRYYKQRAFFVISKENYEKLKNLTNEVEYINGYFYSTFVGIEYDEENYEWVNQNGLDGICEAIDKGYVEKLSIIKFRIYKATDGSIRFLLPKSKLKMDNNYFETDAETFNQLLILE